MFLLLSLPATTLAIYQQVSVSPSLSPSYNSGCLSTGECFSFSLSHLQLWLSINRLVFLLLSLPATTLAIYQLLARQFMYVATFTTILVRYFCIQLFIVLFAFLSFFFFVFALFCFCLQGRVVGFFFHPNLRSRQNSSCRMPCKEGMGGGEGLGGGKGGGRGGEAFQQLDCDLSQCSFLFLSVKHNTHQTEPKGGEKEHKKQKQIIALIHDTYMKKQQLNSCKIYIISRSNTLVCSFPSWLLNIPATC